MPAPAISLTFLSLLSPPSLENSSRSRTTAYRIPVSKVPVSSLPVSSLPMPNFLVLCHFSVFFLENIRYLRLGKAIRVMRNHRLLQRLLNSDDVTVKATLLVVRVSAACRKRRQSVKNSAGNSQRFIIISGNSTAWLVSGRVAIMALVATLGYQEGCIVLSFDVCVRVCFRLYGVKVLGYFLLKEYC